MYTFMYFYEFVRKLCYKIKMSKRDVQSPLNKYLRHRPAKFGHNRMIYTTYKFKKIKEKKKEKKRKEKTSTIIDKASAPFWKSLS